MRFLTIFILFMLANDLQAKSFVYCSEGSPSTFNPQLATDGTTFNASSRPIYNRLVDFEKGTTKIIPSLATQWNISKDGLIYTFTLRQGVKFHKTAYFNPSREFNADDVLFSFNRMRDRNHPFHKVSGGNYEYFNSMDMSLLIKDLQKINQYSIRITLSKPEAPFLANLAMDFASILSEEYASTLLKTKTPEKLDSFPIGTGPFVFKEYSKDTVIKFISHPDYFEGKSPLDKLIFNITQDPSVRYQKLKTGECHLIAYPSPSDLKMMKNDKNIVILEQAGLNIGYLAFNVEKKPFDQKVVRQAIHHALNRQNYIDAIYLGNAQIATNPIPPSMWSYNDKIKDYEYSPEKSKKLLSQAGYPNGFEMELWTLPVSRPYIPDGKKMGELIQADLAKVGIKVKLLTFDWPTYLEKSKKGEHQAIELGWTGDNGDPDNFFNVLLGCTSVKAGSNVARWCNKTFAEHIDQAKLTTNINKRTELYLRAQDIFKKEAPWVTLAHAKVFRALRSNVTGFQINPFGSDIFYGVDLKE